MMPQAIFWPKWRRLEEARPEFLRTIRVFDKLGITEDVKSPRTVLRWIEDGKPLV